MDLEEIIKKCEDALSQLKYAEKALNQCNEICEAYFTYGYKNEGNNIRYSTIKKIIERYYTKKGENYESRRHRNGTSGDKPIQSKSG